jgi:hypothetical protein
LEVDEIGWFSAEEIKAMGDEEIIPDARHPAVAALSAGPGLMEDLDFPGRSDSFRGFLVPC